MRLLNMRAYQLNPRDQAVSRTSTTNWDAGHRFELVS